MLTFFFFKRFKILVQLNSLCITLLNFYPVNLQHPVVCIYFSIRVENSVDPDQMASQKRADPDLQCFPSAKKDKYRFKRTRLN